MDPHHSVSASLSARSVVPQLKDFVLTEKLGSGTYATVYKAFKKVLMTTKSKSIDSIDSSNNKEWCRLCVQKHDICWCPLLSREQHCSKEGGSHALQFMTVWALYDVPVVVSHVSLTRLGFHSEGGN